MAMAGLPEQGDVRAVAGALNLDTVCLQFRIEETDADQRGMDRGLAALVKGMVKRLALARRKGYSKLVNCRSNSRADQACLMASIS